MGLFFNRAQGSHLTPNQQSLTPVFGLGLPTFQENLTKLHGGTPTFLRKCPWDSCFKNPSEYPGAPDKRREEVTGIILG